MAFFQKLHFNVTSTLGPVYYFVSLKLPVKFEIFSLSIHIETLLNFHNGTKQTLGQSLKKSLESDPVNPVLLDLHFEAVDRRVELILKVIRVCITNSENINDVIFNNDDQYDSGYDAVKNDKAFLNENGH